MARELRALRGDRQRLAVMGERAHLAALRAHGPERATRAWLDMLAELPHAPATKVPLRYALRLQSGT
jgi:spore germination cell wall hydrolase CwlJ-like protein